MPRETRRARPGSLGIGDSGPSVRLVQKGTFRKEGEYWTIGYGAKSLRLKDTKGLGYIAHLLRHPGIEFHVLDLAGGIAGQRDDEEAGQSEQRLPRGDEDLEKAGIHIGSLGDAGEMLDEQAKSAYRRRLSDLREQLQEAKQQGNVERAQQAEQEIDALTRELSRAVGLGGRNRRAMSASERARQSISKTIKSVLDRIAQSDAGLADILARCIKTGNFCSYEPDPDYPIAWEFAATIERPDEPTPGRDPSPAQADRPLSQQSVLTLSPFSLAERTAFVGRESEVRAIRTVIDRAREGHGSVVMLWDGPGVGKSRLAVEIAEYALRGGFRCSVGHCYEREEPDPYLPFTEIMENNLAQAASLEDYSRQMGSHAAELAQIAPSLRRIFPDIPKPLELPAAQQRGYLFQSLAEAMARSARIRPCIYLLEDLHWADESTLALLAYLANRIAQLPAVIIGTYRSGYSDTNPALVRTLEELIRIGVRPQKLNGLSKNAVEQMLHGLSERKAPESLVSFIFEESQGYPFFVEEVYRHLSEEGKVFDPSGQFRADLKLDENDVPENVRLIISRRLERLDASEKRALTAAAVIGRSFSFQLLTAVSQIDIDELFTVLEKAQRMGIVVPSSEGPEKPFTFAHELVRQTLLAAISIVRRQQLHAKVAAALESLDPTSAKEYAGEISDHLVKAGSFADREALVRWLLEAGNQALEASAFEEARVSFELALSRVDDSDSRRRAETLYSLGMAKRGLGRWSEAHVLWEQALEIFEALADQESIAWTCRQLAEGAAAWSGKQREALETAERLLAKLSTTSGDRAFLLAILALGKLDADEPDAAREVFTEALAVAEKLPDPGVKGAILVFRSKFNFVCLHLREALEDSLRSAQLLTPAAAWIRAEQLLWHKATLLQLGRMQEADNINQELEPLASRIGHLPALSSCRRTSAWIEFWRQPDLARLEDKIRGDLDAQTESGMNPFFMSAAQLSTAEFLSGKWDQALRHAESAWSREAPGHVQAMNVAVRFRLMAYSGDRAGALALMNGHREMVARAGKTNIYGSWMLLVAAIEGLFVLGEREQAAGLYRDVLELIHMGTVFVQILSRFPRTVAGMSAAAARNWNVASEHFRIGLEQAEALPNQLEQTEIRRFHAMMLLDRAATGDRKKAQMLLRDAMETYAQIGMPRHIEMTQTLLARAAGRQE